MVACANTTNDFAVGSNLKNVFDQVKMDLIVANYSAEEAGSRAMAFVMKDSGITLLKASSGSNDFKKIGLNEVKNPDGTLKKDSNGNQVYETQDCPPN